MPFSVDKKWQDGQLLKCIQTCAFFCLIYSPQTWYENAVFRLVEAQRTYYCQDIFSVDFPFKNKIVLMTFVLAQYVTSWWSRQSAILTNCFHVLLPTCRLHKDCCMTLTCTCSPVKLFFLDRFHNRKIVKIYHSLFCSSMCVNDVQYLDTQTDDVKLLILGLDMNSHIVCRHVLRLHLLQRDVAFKLSL